MPESLILPQPPLNENDANGRPIRPYKYVPYDVLDADWLGDPRRLQSLMGVNFETGNGTSRNGNPGGDGTRYAPGTLVWVLLSKGKPKHPDASARSGYDALALHRKRRDKKNKRKHGGHANAPIENDNGQSSGAADCCAAIQNGNGNTDTAAAGGRDATTLNRSRKEFFLRARVVSDDEPPSRDGDGTPRKRSERRVLVRYSRGSTYRVRAYNLVPVLEPRIHNAEATGGLGLPPLVVVVPETCIYRRVARVHTTPDDGFLEIGCDYGITVDKIRTSLEEAGDVPREWPVEGGDDAGGGGASRESGGEDGVRCLGIDKSKESIDVATERYPKCKFALANVLAPDGMSSVRALCERSLVGAAPSVVCIDINGNREMDGVLDCLRAVMNERWRRRPRMIVVKSRFLYWELKKADGDKGRL